MEAKKIIGVLIVLLFLWIVYRGLRLATLESFLSFAEPTLSDYGREPTIVLVRSKHSEPAYPEIDATTQMLDVMEIFLQPGLPMVFQLYRDDGLVWRGQLPANLNIPPSLGIASGQHYCPVVRVNQWRYYLIYRGDSVDLGSLSESCLPAELRWIWPIAKLMHGD